jgi:hypothetical protein
VLHDPDLAEAIIDRVLERGRLVELRGASYRTRHLKRAETDRSPLREGARISGNQGPEFPEPTRRNAAAALSGTRSCAPASIPAVGADPARRGVVIYSTRTAHTLQLQLH